MRRTILLIAGIFISHLTQAQYIDWKMKRIVRDIERDCNCEVYVDYPENQKAVVEFSNFSGVDKMVFHLDDDDFCYGYTVYCNEKYEQKLTAYIENNFEYNKGEDYYENNQSYLFYQAEKEKKIVHILAKRE